MDGVEFFIEKVVAKVRAFNCGITQGEKDDIIFFLYEYIMNIDEENTTKSVSVCIETDLLSILKKHGWTNSDDYLPDIKIKLSKDENSRNNHLAVEATEGSTVICSLNNEWEIITPDISSISSARNNNGSPR